ncbi:MAG: PqqD family protein [Thermomicrobiales bacterium]
MTEEWVVFDTIRLTYHTLNAPAMQIWQLCDGQRSVSVIANVLAKDNVDLSEEAVAFGVEELFEAGLLANSPPDSDSGLSRRTLMQSLTAAGLGGILLPGVSSISAPVAAEGLSNVQNSYPCSAGDTCLPGPAYGGLGTTDYCCAPGNDTSYGSRCVPVNIVNVPGGCTPVGGLCANWGSCY